MSDDLRVKVAKSQAGDWWDTITGCQRGVLLRDADRAIDICRQEYEAEIARLRRERAKARKRGFESAVHAMIAITENWRVHSRDGEFDDLRAAIDQINALLKEDADD